VAVEVWQDSHGALVWIWSAPLPGAMLPLWQLAQLLLMLVWTKRAPAQALDEWQVLQASLVGTWLTGLAVVARMLPVE
jgi:hypothetical protein